jgi:hypothetical protein
VDLYYNVAGDPTGAETYDDDGTLESTVDILYDAGGPAKSVRVFDESYNQIGSYEFDYYSIDHDRLLGRRSSSKRAGHCGPITTATRDSHALLTKE